MSHFSKEDIAILSQYVTNTDSNVYGIKNLPGIVGAVFARYSRATTTFRETLLKEFIQEGKLDPKKAEELIQRVLIAYGDDSVGELEGAHLAFENISMLATKEIEDRRIGGSPIEKSTRYVLFDKKDAHGQYAYVREPSIMQSPYAADYTTTLDMVFDTYTELIEPMQEYYRAQLPKDIAEYDILGTGEKQLLSDLTQIKDIKAFERTYRMDIRTKACDTLRCLLPLATKTNVGLYGNGRFWQMLISHLLSTSYPEVTQLGMQAFTELSQLIPNYVKRAKAKEYNIKIDESMRSLAKELFSGISIDTSIATVTVLPVAWRNTEEFLITHMLYPYVAHPFTQIYELVKRMSQAQQTRIKQTYVGTRRTRRDRPGRAFESGYRYTIDLCADWGTYKDLQRHRMNTQLRQTFSPKLGFVIPHDLADAGYKQHALAIHEKILELYNSLQQHLGAVASYTTLHGHRTRWIMGFNDREAHHMLELRTTPQGHPQYRALCQEIHHQIAEQDPWRASVMQFVDHNSYHSARGDSEARQRVKERQLQHNDES